MKRLLSSKGAPPPSPPPAAARAVPKLAAVGRDVRLSTYVSGKVLNRPEVRGGVSGAANQPSLALSSPEGPQRCLIW